MMLKISLLILILYTTLFSQVLVQNFKDDPQYSESPQTGIRSSGIGNYGFDSMENFYNPHYCEFDSEFSIGITSIINYKSGMYRKRPDENMLRYAENINNSAIDLFFKFKHGNYIFHLNYFTTLFLHQKFRDNLDTIHMLETYNGPFTIVANNPTYYIFNKSIQIALSRKFGQFSMTFGFATNRYEYTIEMNEPYKIGLKTDYLENIQILFTLNYIYKNLFHFYFLGKSYDAEIQMVPMISAINVPLINRYKLMVSYPALLAYGFQYYFSKNLKLSIEICHDYLPKNDDPKLYRRWSQELFTSEIVLGINYKIIKNIESGISYSKYLVYNSSLRQELHIPYQGAQFFPLTDLQRFRMSVNYLYQDFTFCLSFKYALSEHDVPGFGTFEEDSHFIRFGITLKL